jgi:hypothetical protein
MEQIKETVATVVAGLKSRGCRGEGAEESISGAFSKKEQEHIRVEPCRAGKALIAVDSSTWLYYFNLKKKELLEKIAAAMPEVKEIVFIIGNINSGKK